MVFNKLEWQKNYRKKTCNRDTKLYEKTKKGFLVRVYRNMLSRVRGVVHLKNHLYLGKSILEKETFYNWSLQNSSFHTLFEDWEKHDFMLKKTPSINRINSDIGYELDNLEWISFSENCKRTKRNLYGKK